MWIPLLGRSSARRTDFRRAWRAEPSRPVFKNNLGEGQIPAVCDRQRNILYAHFIRPFSRDALKLQRRLSARLADHFDVAPAYSRAPACPQSFHRRFFRGEPSCISLKFISMAFAVGGFARREQAFDQRSAMPLDSCFDAIDFCDVQPQADDQAPSAFRKLKPSYLKG